MRVLLFDIDGTLIRSGGAGKAAMEAGLREAFGITEILDRVSYSGRTDLLIGRDLLTLQGIEPTPENLRRLESAYLAHLPEMLRRMTGEVLPGVVEVLEQVSGRLATGLLTGNVQRGAEIKLRHFDLWHRFEFGGFADGRPSRNDVARHALEVAQAHLKRAIDPREVWVLGDTPHDVECARAIGARAVALGTGWHSPEELLQCGPDHYLPDLTHAGPLLAEWSR